MLERALASSGFHPARPLADMDGDGALEAFINGNVYGFDGEVTDWAGDIAYSAEQELRIDIDGDGDIDRINVVTGTIQRASGLQLSAASGLELPSDFVPQNRIFVLPEHGRGASWTWWHNSATLFPLILDDWPDTGNAYAALVDFTGDGLVDLLVADGHAGNDSGIWEVYENLGSTFDSAPAHWEVQGSFDGYGFATDRFSHSFAHLDGDGRADLICAACGSEEPGRISMFLNTGTGFEANGELPQTASEGQTSVVSDRYGRIDIDLDGDIDLLDLTGDLAADGGWPLWLNDGGAFREPVLWSVPVGSEHFVDHALLDINGDGTLDLLRNTISQPTVHLGCLPR